MDFLFSKEKEYDENSLYQGDLLVRNDRLQAAIRQAHAYYADAPDYTHFLVLTQSCDLVLRDGKPKSHYVVLAAVRPLKKVIDRFLDQYEYTGFNLPRKIRPKNREVSAKQFLERLLHNDADGYFFIRQDGLPALPYDVCAFLPLSIALGVEHYDACLSAKIAQLESIFSAKVGWLTGNLYSRIGTPAIEEKCPEPTTYKNKFYEQILYEKSVWLTARQKSLLKEKLKEWATAHPGQNIDEPTLDAMLAELPDDVSMVVTRVLQLLTNKSYVSAKPSDQEAATNILINDQILKSIITAAEQAE